MKEGRMSVTLNKTTKRLVRETQRAIDTYGMIQSGERVLVCLSGGKDSWTLLEILRTLVTRGALECELIAFNLDQRQPGFPEHVLPEALERMGVRYHIESVDTYSVVERLIPEGRTMCSLCSRLRRGNIYRVARELGADKIALGHHRDDIIQTFFLNLFHGGKLKAMPPKLLSDDQAHCVIRPLAFCEETDIERFAKAQAFPIIPCNLCGSQEHLQRKTIARMLADWEEASPGRAASIFRALQNIEPATLADPTLFDFASLSPKLEAITKRASKKSE